MCLWCKQALVISQGYATEVWTAPAEQIQVTVEVILGADGQGCYTQLYVKEREKHVLGVALAATP